MASKLHIFCLQLLEEKSVENAKVENEVVLLRKKIARGLNRNSVNSPSFVSILFPVCCIIQGVVCVWFDVSCMLHPVCCS